MAIEGIACPYCGSEASKCVDSRPRHGGYRVRRRECDVCAKRYSTVEVAVRPQDKPEIMVHLLREPQGYLVKKLNTIRQAMTDFENMLRYQGEDTAD